ncbi:MAG: hypothetical protein JNJ77_11975 [Planctomycetia bacterium]|nr:hypothetical protein [Planctomycetia bacterium]
MMRILFALFTVICIHSTVWAQPVSVFIIDTFNNTINSPSDAVNDSTINGTAAWLGFGPLTGVLGSNRVMGNYLTEVDPGSSPPYLNNATRVGSGVFSIDNPFDTRSGGQIIWQGNTTTPGTNPITSHPASFGLGNLDFNTILTDPNFYFQWSVINADNRDWTYTVRAYTNNASNYFEGSVTSNQSGVLLDIARINFLVGAGAPNWADIDAISFSASYSGGLLGGDLAINFLQLAVPEMSTYMMIGLMLLLGGAVYTYRKSSKEQKKTEIASETVASNDATPVVPTLTV